MTKSAAIANKLGKAEPQSVTKSAIANKLGKAEPRSMTKSAVVKSTDSVPGLHYTCRLVSRVLVVPVK